MGCKLPGAIAAAMWLGGSACSGVAPDLSRALESLPPAVALDATEAAEVAERVQLAANQLALGDMARARDGAAAVLDLDPRHALARAIHGAALMALAQAVYPPELSQWRRAEAEFLRAAHLDPEDPEVAVLQGEFYAADGHLTAAAEAVERALGAHPAHEGCRRLAATWRYELGEERLARPHLEQLLALRPDDPLALYRLGWCRAVLAGESSGLAKPDLLGDLAVALELFDRYLATVDDDPHGYLAAAQTALRAADAAPSGESSAWLDRVGSLVSTGLERFPRRAQFPFLDGLRAEKAGDPTAAEAAYRRALTIDPEHVGAALNLSQLLVAQGETASAREVLLRLLQADPLRSDLTDRERRSVRAFLDEPAEGGTGGA